MNDERLSTWILSEMDGIGPSGFAKLIEKFGSAAAVFQSSLKDLQIAEVNPKIANQIAQPRDWDNLSNDFQKTIPELAQVVAYTEPDYPSKLKNITNPPPLLYVKGQISIFNRPSLAVVGSRKPSDYGLRMTSRLVGELAAAGVVIVSGMAYGIDGAAHQAAIEAGGFTAAVFGCGLDFIYPPGHKTLASKIERSGCLISEFPKGIKPERFNFPVRNRIVSGLSDGVLVIEAGEKSGALVTAGLALDQGRDVLAIPGSVESEYSLGPNWLIKQGAVAVTSAQDIFDNFDWHRPEETQQKDLNTANLPKDELLIYEQVSIQPVHLDELGRKATLSPGKIAEALLKLELKGLIMRKPGNYIVRA